MPVVENWQSYMLPNHSASAAIEEEDFLVGTWVRATLEKMAGSYLVTEIRTDARCFIE